MIQNNQVKLIQARLARKDVPMTSAQIREYLANSRPEVTEFDEAELSKIVEELSASVAMVPAMDNEILTTTDEPLLPPTESTLTISEKQELVAETAQQIGVTLLGSEIKQIAQSIASGFDSREQLFNEVTNAIVAFVEYRIGAQGDALKDAALRIRAKLGEGNSTTRDVFSGIRQDIDSTNTDFKSNFEGITALFAIPS
jgi:hypothetical protein